MISKQLRTKLCEGTVMKNLKEDTVKKEARTILGKIQQVKVQMQMD